jgi:GGDEF domain-containing protein
VQAASEIVDHAAATIADALRSAVRGSDTLARMSALDFAIIAPNLDRELAVRVIERFRLHLARLNPEGGIAVRAGLATLDPAACQDPDALLQLARSAADVLAPEPPVPTA